MRVWETTEAATTWLDGFDPAWLPPRSHDYVRVVQRSTGVGLEIGSYVGAIPLLNGETLQIRPKAGQLNFLRMLLVTEGVFNDLRQEFDGYSNYGTSDDATFNLIICRRFLNELIGIERSSLRFDRTRSRVREDFVRGRVEPLSTSLNLALHRDRPVVSQIRARTFDLPEHRVLTQAARLAYQFDGLSAEQRAVALRWIRRFGSTAMSREDLEDVDRLLVRQRLMGSRGYYVPALALAKMILGTSGLSQVSGGDWIPGDPIVINSADLFESYIRTVLQGALAKKGVITSKGGALTRTLYVDGTFGLIPDYLFSKDNVIQLIADAKYKEPDASDHYQMHCYLTRYEVRSGILFSPNFGGEEIVVLERLTPEGTAIRQVLLPMGSLDHIESELVQVVERYRVH